MLAMKGKLLMRVTVGKQQEGKAGNRKKEIQRNTPWQESCSNAFLMLWPNEKLKVGDIL